MPITEKKIKSKKRKEDQCKHQKERKSIKKTNHYNYMILFQAMVQIKFRTILDAFITRSCIEFQIA